MFRPVGTRSRGRISCRPLRSTLTLSASQSAARRDSRAVRVVALPGKLLVMIKGKPMIVRTYEQAAKATTLTRLVVATDDVRIKRACEAAGAEVVMTDDDIPNGTERAAQALDRLGGKFDVVVNIQGDEPLIEPGIIDDVVRALQRWIPSTPPRSPRSSVRRSRCTPASSASSTRLATPCISAAG